MSYLAMVDPEDPNIRPAGFSFLWFTTMAFLPTKNWSRFASGIFLLLIILQIPLFRVPCRIGVCITPIELTSCQLIATGVYPAGVVKSLLYPGAIAKSIVKSKPIPKFNDLLNVYNLKEVKNAPQRTDLQHIEVVVGSYLAIVGALMGLFRKGRRLGLIGILLIIWGLSIPILVGKHAVSRDHREDFSICYPTMTVAVISGFFSIRRDARKIISWCKWTIFSKAKYS